MHFFQGCITKGSRSQRRMNNKHKEQLVKSNILHKSQHQTQKAENLLKAAVTGAGTIQAFVQQNSENEQSVPAKLLT